MQSPTLRCDRSFSLLSSPSSRRTRRLGLFFGLAALVVAGCGGAPMPASAEAPEGPAARDAPVPGVPGAPPAPAPKPAGAPDVQRASFPSTPSTPSTAPGTDKAGDAKTAPDAFIVYVGDLGMTADAAAIPATLDKVVDVAESLGGHLAGRTDTTVKVKIPSKHFREGMTDVEGLGEITRRSVTADDVTAEFEDLQVRLENLRATRKRLEDFLAKAQNIPDTLTVEHELERVAMEIDTLEGRLRVLSDSTSFSVLTVSMTPKPKPVEAVVAKEPHREPPSPRMVALPIDWLGDLGIAPLLDLKRGS